MKREPYLVYSILIEDKAVVALEARESEARELCKEKGFLEALSYLMSNGEPLYRPGLRIRARPAIEEEWIRYDKACSAADNAFARRPAAAHAEGRSRLHYEAALRRQREDYGQVLNRRLAKRDQLSRQFSLAYRATRSALLGLQSGR